ncbi:CvpA family protein [Noviherbaspirillum aerium]|uniref:CvpA family protein n=1 Tax=Noviherbaspirillum aerium TaxID=2588497 RepID=UPI00124E9B52|nr:CvpA family protein [Noviherbaspirillum aerium]
MELNWIDLLLGALILLSMAMGWRRGFLQESADLAAWLAGLLLGLHLYAPAARWLAGVSGWPAAWSRPAAFLAIFFAGLLAVRLLAALLLSHLSHLSHRSRLPRQAHLHSANKALGVAPGFANGLIHAMVAAALLLSVPLPQDMQRQARDSELANRFAGYAEVVEAALLPVFDEAIGKTMNMLTVQPQSSEMVKLPFRIKETKPLPELEARMLELLNRERLAAGLKPLTMHAELTAVGRAHSADMLARGYFSHHSPEGKSAFDRMRAAGISFRLAGENLAFAPTVKLAHTGLMNSPGHRANILRPQFGKVGIGIMDAGRRGIMVTQQFSN